LTFAALVTASWSARAEDGAFALNHFAPSEPGSDWFASESLDFRGKMRPTLGLVADYARRPLVAHDDGGNVVASVVDQQSYAHLGASLVLRNRLRLSFNLPVLAATSGQSVRIDGGDVASPASSFAFGDLRLGVDASIYGTYDDPLRVALGLQVYLPTGDQASYASDGSMRATPRLLAAGRSNAIEWSTRLDFAMRQTHAFAGTTLGDSLDVAGAVGYRLASGQLVVGPELYATTTLTESAFTKGASPVEALLGAHYTVRRDFRIGAAMGTGITGGLGSPRARGLLSLAWAPAFRDADRDGIEDIDDACPAEKGVPSSDPRRHGCAPDRDQDGVMDVDDACGDVKGVKTADIKTNGCPPDADRDGIVDEVDACRTTPGVQSADPKANGCPPDKDFDGIPDADDACPTQPGTKNTDSKLNGCVADKDGDGVIDGEDACPDQKGQRNADPKLNGCYVDPDRDKDGVENERDACPDVAGTMSPESAKNGCPLVQLRGDKIEIRESVQFKSGGDEILAQSDELLSKVAALLKDHNEITMVLVEGYTDNRGKKDGNVTLSELRAHAVMVWLKKHGVERKRLTSKGFGEDKPIASNDTDEGRAKNRRVEFRVVATLASARDAKVKADKASEKKPDAKASADKASEKKPDAKASADQASEKKPDAKPSADQASEKKPDAKPKADTAAKKK
jgi:outer membrane protein OmpA-like peptidoglycan-associated protein